MEELQCDGCDFRAESHDDLKTHIQEVHTAFLQPTDVGDNGSPEQSGSDSLNSPDQKEDEEEEEEEDVDEVEEDDTLALDKEYEPQKTEKGKDILYALFKVCN